LKGKVDGKTNAGGGKRTSFFTRIIGKVGTPSPQEKRGKIV